MKKQAKQFAWPFDPTSDDDGICLDDAGFPVTDDHSYDRLFAIFAKNYKKSMGELPDEDIDVAFFIVSEDTHRAASCVPLGEWDAETMRYTEIRRGILKDGALETVRK